MVPNNTVIDRRKVLQSVGATGLMASGIIGTTSASDGNRNYIGKCNFIEVGVEYDTDRTNKITEVTQLSPYSLDLENKSANFHIITKELVEKIKNNDSILKAGTFSTLPTTIGGEKSRSIPIMTNDHQDPTHFLSLPRKVKTPPLRVRYKADEGVDAGVGGDKTLISTGESQQLEFSPQELTTESGNVKKIKPIFTVTNHGDLEISYGGIE